MWLNGQLTEQKCWSSDDGVYNIARNESTNGVLVAKCEYVLFQN